jgi:hypothetical protein
MWFVLNYLVLLHCIVDRICGLEVRVPGYRSRGPGSIPGTTRFFEVGLERGPPSLMSTIEELLGRESGGFGRKDPSRWPRGTLYSQKLVLTSLTSGGCSIGIVHSRTQATEFRWVFFFFFFFFCCCIVIILCIKWMPGNSECALYVFTVTTVDIYSLYKWLSSIHLLLYVSLVVSGQFFPNNNYRLIGC